MIQPEGDLVHESKALPTTITLPLTKVSSVFKYFKIFPHFPILWLSAPSLKAIHTIPQCCLSLQCAPVSTLPPYTAETPVQPTSCGGALASSTPLGKRGQGVLPPRALCEDGVGERGGGSASAPVPRASCNSAQGRRQCS